MYKTSQAAGREPVLVLVLNGMHVCVWTATEAGVPITVISCILFT